MQWQLPRVCEVGWLVESCQLPSGSCNLILGAIGLAGRRLDLVGGGDGVGGVECEVAVPFH